MEEYDECNQCVIMFPMISDYSMELTGLKIDRQGSCLVTPKNLLKSVAYMFTDIEKLKK